MERARELLSEYGLFILLGGVGAFILLYGLWSVMMPTPAVVEIVKGQESQVYGELVVDVAGQVEKPGVYKLPSGSRIGDAIVLAGGLSADADREWVSKTLNMAQEVKDGEKVYIPGQSDNPVSQSGGGSATQSGLVNINTASASELDNLEGIGEVRAQAIIANRPYASTGEIVEKAKVPQSVYDKIKDRLSVY